MVLTELYMTFHPLTLGLIVRVVDLMITECKFRVGLNSVLTALVLV